MKIRIRIREQICLLIAITALLALMVLSVSVWVQSHHYISQTRAQTLQVTANMKANQIGQYLTILSDSVGSLATRDRLQELMEEYNSGNATSALRSDLAVSVFEEVSTAPAANVPRLTSSMLYPEVQTIRFISKLRSTHAMPPTTLVISKLSTRLALAHTVVMSYHSPTPTAAMSGSAIRVLDTHLSCIQTSRTPVTRIRQPSHTMAGNLPPTPR